MARGLEKLGARGLSLHALRRDRVLGVSLPAPPPEPTRPLDWKPGPPRSLRSILAGLALGVTVLVAIVGTLWVHFTAPEPPAGTTVAVERQPLTQYGADRAAGALLVAWDDVDHLRFVTWDINRLTGCVPLAMKYDGPLGHTDPRSIPKDIQHDVVGRARYKQARLKVWWGC